MNLAKVVVVLCSSHQEMEIRFITIIIILPHFNASVPDQKKKGEKSKSSTIDSIYLNYENEKQNNKTENTNLRETKQSVHVDAQFSKQQKQFWIQRVMYPEQQSHA